MSRYEIKKGSQVMECPYCKNEMIKGYLYGERYALKWMSADKGLIADTFVSRDSIKLESNTFWGRQRAKAFRCTSCNKLIIDINDTL